MLVQPSVPVCCAHDTRRLQALSSYLQALSSYPQAWKSKTCDNNNRFYFKNSMENTHVDPGLDNQGTEYEWPGVNIR